MFSNLNNTIGRILTCRIPYTKHTFLLPYIFFIILICIFPFNVPRYDLAVEFGGDYANASKLYFLRAGYNWNEEDSVIPLCDDNRAVFKISSKSAPLATSYRMDISNTITDVTIDYISIKRGVITVKKYSGKELKSFIYGKNNIQKVTAKDEKLIFKTTGTPASLVFENEMVTYVNMLMTNYLRILSIIILTVAFLIIMSVITFKYEENGKFSKKLLRADKLSLKRKIIYIFAVLFTIIAAVIYTVCQFFVKNFSGLSIDEIIFHLKIPMTGTSDDMFKEYFEQSAVFLLVTFGILLILIILFALKKDIRNLLFVNTLSMFLSVALLLVSIWKCSYELDLSSYIRIQMAASNFIEENYVDVKEVKLTFPEKKRNLIYIFLESMESTFCSKENGGAMDKELIPELAFLAKENINFSESDNVGGSYPSVGTGWTVAGMVAQTSGMPLLIPIEGNSYGEYSSFMPGVTSLGEILKDAGYNQEVMVGSDISFGGRKLYFSQHGDYQLYDLITARENGKIPQDYYVWWGYEDKKLFSYAKEEIANLAKQDKPFNFTMLTVDTHFIAGYVCDECGNEYEEQYENVISCSSRQVDSFVKWIQQQDFYEDTTIIISGDHLTMDNDYIDKYYDNSHPRKVYNCFINSIQGGGNTKNRIFNTFDLFPSTLAAMGVEIEGEHLGLGTNLFSGEKTLAEQYGLNYIDNEFSKSSRFYKKEILGE